MADASPTASSPNAKRTETRLNNAPLVITHLSLRNKVMRSLWKGCWLILYRPSPIFLHGWRRVLLRSFGAQIGHKVHPYPSAKIWAPWNLVMHDGSCLAHHVDCYCVSEVFIGKNAIVSQYSYLCSASHDYRDRAMPLIAAPITIEEDAWVAADVFVGPGVTIGKGAVIGARSTVIKSIPARSIAAGNPARVIKQRERK